MGRTAFIEKKAPEYITLTSKHLVFVYGTVKKGHRNNCALGRTSRLIAEAYIEGLGMYGTDRCPFPMAIPTIDPSSKIEGEIYEVSGGTLRHLDILEAVDSGMFNRVKMRAIEKGTREQHNVYVYIVSSVQTLAEILLPEKNRTTIRKMKKWTLEDEK